MATSVCVATRLVSVGGTPGRSTRLTVVGRILLAGNHGLRMEERPVVAALDLIDGARLEVDVEGAGNVLARASLGEESGKATIATSLRLLGRAAVRLFAIA